MNRLRKNINMRWKKCLKCGLRIYLHRQHICPNIILQNNIYGKMGMKKGESNE